MNILKVILALVCISLISSPTYSAYRVAPGVQYVDLKRPKTIKFMVKNTGTTNEFINATVEYQPLSTQTVGLGQPLKVNKNQDNLKPYIKISPRFLRLKPQQERTLRVTIRPPKSLKDGSYRANILFTPRDITQRVRTKKNEQGISTAIGFKLLTSVTIYGKRGSGEPDPKLTCNFNAQNNEVSLSGINNSPWIFYTLYEANQKNKDNDPYSGSLPLMPYGKNKASFKLKSIKAPVTITYHNRDGDTSTKKITCQSV